MAKWMVVGVNEMTGDTKTVEVEAESEAEAKRRAADVGFLIESVHPASLGRTTSPKRPFNSWTNSSAAFIAAAVILLLVVTASVFWERREDHADRDRSVAPAMPNQPDFGFDLAEANRQAEIGRARRRASTVELDFERLTPASEGRIGDGFVVVGYRGTTIIAERDGRFIEVDGLKFRPRLGDSLSIDEALQVVRPRVIRRLNDGRSVEFAILAPIPRAGG